MLLIPLALAGVPDLDVPLRTTTRHPEDAAVVIGIEHYPFLGADVPYAAADARLMQRLFVYTRGIPDSRVSVLTDDPTRDDILAAVSEEGAKVGPGGTLFVYFAGHGAASSDRKRTLLGADVKARADSFDSRGVEQAEVQQAGGAGGGKVVLIVDACFGGVGRDGTRLLDGTRWVVPVAEEPDAWVAAGPNQVASPLDATGHGLFTWLAAGAMRGWADGALGDEPDGTVTGAEADAWVRSALVTMGRRDQEPRLSEGLGGFVWTEGVGERLDRMELAELPERVPAAVAKPTARRTVQPLVVGGLAVLGAGALTAGTTFVMTSIDPTFAPPGETTPTRIVNYVGLGLGGVGLGMTGVGLVIGPTSVAVSGRF